MAKAGRTKELNDCYFKHGCHPDQAIARGGIFAPNICTVGGQCVDPSTSFHSARDDRCVRNSPLPKILTALSSKSSDGSRHAAAEMFLIEKHLFVVNNICIDQGNVVH
jgi:hypothetical protein